MDNLEAKSLTLSYDKGAVISDLNLTIPEGEITVFIGGNGCGKSTLLRSFARLLKPESGTVLLGGEEINKIPTKEVAKRLAILPQSPVAPEGMKVYQLVKQGRYPHQSWLQQWSREDEYAVNKALKATKITDLANRSVTSLSGGQKQRAWIAMTLAQQTDIVLLDEPTTYLDLAHQIEILDLLYELNEDEDTTIVMVLHDLNLAARYADNIVAIKNKGVYIQGKPEEVFTAEMVSEVFGMESKIISDPIYGTPYCIPAGKDCKILKEAK